MTVEVLKAKVATVEKDADRLASDMKEVKDKVNEIDNRMVRIEEKQVAQTDDLKSIQSTLMWLLRIVVGGFLVGVVNYILKGGLV